MRKEGSKEGRKKGRTKERTNQLMNERTNERTRERTNEPASLSTNQPTNQPTNKESNKGRKGWRNEWRQERKNKKSIWVCWIYYRSCVNTFSYTILSSQRFSIAHNFCYDFYRMVSSLHIDICRTMNTHGSIKFFDRINKLVFHKYNIQVVASTLYGHFPLPSMNRFKQTKSATFTILLFWPSLGVLFLLYYIS